MFKKLKEKVIDSQTSQRIQQITQTVSDKFQSLDKEDNFFSLTEDDNAINSPTTLNMEPGFSNISLTERNRRTSISSMTSDTSFLPRCDSLNSVYHLQSDLDVSEIEDNASTASSQIGHLSKDQIYTAFQKSQMRYHKYRGRFTDLANHYKNLEREFTKLKTELEKTQERSFRRVKELKEQCDLEQKAKAHLESSLRVDLDEKQIQINTLKEKITLLQNGSNQHLDYDQLKQENENLNSAVQESKAKLIVLQSKENEYKEKIQKLNEEIRKIQDDQKATNLKVAESKMQIHNELVTKEAELNMLRQENETLKCDAKTGPGNNKLELLQNQNANLIEKVENLSTKCQNLNGELLKMEQLKLELQTLKTKMNEEKSAHDNEIIEITREADNFKAKLFKEKQEKEDLIDNLEKVILDNKSRYEDEISHLKTSLETVRNDAKLALLSIEEKIRNKLETEYNEKEENVKKKFEEKLEQLNNEERGAQTLQLDLISAKEELEKLTENLKENTCRYEDLEANYLKLNEELSEEKSKNASLEKQLKKFEGVDEKIARLNASISTLKQENQELISSTYQNTELNANLLKSNEELAQEKVITEVLEQKLRNFEGTEAKLAKLEMENAELCEKFELVGRERNEALHSFDGLREEFEKLADLNRNNQAKIEKLTEENAELARVTLAKNEELRSLKENVEFLEKYNHELSESERENQEKLNENTELQEKLEKLSSELETSSKKILEYEKLLVELRDNEQFEILKGNLDEKTRENAELDRKIEALKSELKIKQQFIENLEVNFKILEESNAKLKEEIEARKQENDKKSKDLIRLENTFAEVQKNKKDLVKELNELKQTEEHYHNLLDENENLKEQISEIALLQEKLKTLSEIETEHVELLKINEGISRDYENSKRENDELSTKLRKSLEFERLNELNASEKTQLLNELDEKNAKISELLKEKREADEKTANFTELNVQFERLREENEAGNSRSNLLKEENEALHSKNKQISSENAHFSEENTKLLCELEELKLNVENYSKTQVELEENVIKLTMEKQSLEAKVDEMKRAPDSSLENEQLKQELEQTKKVVENFKEEKRKLESIISELERHQNDLMNEKQLLKEEMDELKISPINNTKLSNGYDQMEQMVDKLTQLKSLDMTNKATIEFYENEIEKLRKNNEKLNRKLDETLVTLNHCAELSQSTELEYLKNVLYNYMLGKESLVLARVIATVCKFEPDQTEEILRKEQQKQTLLAKLGIL